MPWLRKLSSYRRLSPVERRIVRLALGLLVPTPAVLKIMSVPRWRARLGRIARRVELPSPGTTAQARASQRTALLVDIAARYVWPSPSCLHRSLVLECLLHAQGIDANVRFGVRRRDGEFEAHAWVEQGGRPLTAPGDEHEPYAPFKQAERGA